MTMTIKCLRCERRISMPGSTHQDSLAQAGQRCGTVGGRASELSQQLTDGILEGGGGVAIWGGHRDLELQPLSLLHLHPHHYRYLQHTSREISGSSLPKYLEQCSMTLPVAPHLDDHSGREDM